MFVQLYSTPVIVVRPFMVYGPGQAAGKLLPSVVTALVRGQPPRVASGTPRYDWVYVDDIVDALVRAAYAPLPGVELDLGTGTLTSVRELVEMAVQVAGDAIVPQFGALPDRPWQPGREADIETTSALLGWRAATSLPEGLVRTFAWFAAARAEASVDAAPGEWPGSPP